MTEKFDFDNYIFLGITDGCEYYYDKNRNMLVKLCPIAAENLPQEVKNEIKKYQEAAKLNNENELKTDYETICKSMGIESMNTFDLFRYELETLKSRVKKLESYHPDMGDK
jgi:hypothetical protein